MGAVINLTGQRFGRLTVIERVTTNKPQAHWKCLCDCGNFVIVRGQSLREGATKSCGCFRQEASASRASKKTTHGMSHTKINGVWWAIIMRCFNPNYPSYKNYGGRGITVCDEWRNDFTAFYEHVSKLEHFGKDGYTLDRIDNDGNYEPGNVRWATAKEQSRNRRSNIVVEYKGEQLSLKAVAEKSGKKYTDLVARYHRGMRGERLFG